MPVPTYLTACPNCGSQLAPAMLDTQSAPWICNTCSRSWWVCELSPDGHRGWDHQAQSHTPWANQLLSPLRAAEIQASVSRGTSVLLEQLSHLSPRQLQVLSARTGINTAFLAQAIAVMNNKVAGP